MFVSAPRTAPGKSSQQQRVGPLRCSEKTERKAELRFLTPLEDCKDNMLFEEGDLVYFSPEQTTYLQ